MSDAEFSVAYEPATATRRVSMVLRRSFFWPQTRAITPNRPCVPQKDGIFCHRLRTGVRRCIGGTIDVMLRLSFLDQTQRRATCASLVLAWGTKWTRIESS